MAMNRVAASLAKGAKAEEPEAVTVPLKVSTELAAALDPLELLVALLEAALDAAELLLALEEAALSPQAVTPRSSPQAIPPINA
jgi:hypothetical protein